MNLSSYSNRSRRFSLLLNAGRVLLCLTLFSFAFEKAAYAQSVLMVTQNSSLSSSESLRKSTLESWGYTVSTIQDSQSQSSFNTAIASADVVYIPSTADPSDVGYKVRTATCSVICENPLLDVEMGFATSDGYTQSWNTLETVDNSHAVTTGVASGDVVVVSSNQEMSVNTSTIAAGMQTLGTMNFGGLSLGVMESGTALANTYSGNSTASGRRLRSFIGGSAFDITQLNSNGAVIAQNMFTWATAPSGLVGHWDLDETSGTTAADSSSFGNNGTYANGVQLNQSGIHGSAVHFDGDNDRVVIPDHASLQVTSSVTMAAWVYPEQTGNSERMLINKEGEYEMALTDSGELKWAYSNTDPGWSWRHTGAIVPDGKWSHIVVTYVNGTVKTYVNGVLVDSYSGSGSIGDQYPTYDELWIGGRSNNPTGASFGGSIDDARVYAKALTGSEVAELYGLIAHWKLDEASGTIAVDSSLANNDATLTGTQDWTTGQDGGAHEFDYTDGEEYFEAPSNTALDDVQEDDYTIMAYFKPNTVPPGSGSDNDANYAIVVKEGWHIGLTYNPDKQFEIAHTLSDGSWEGTGTWDDTYEPGEFYHVTGVISRTNGTAKIYINGELKQTDTFTSGAASREYGSQPWRLGIAEPGASTWGWAANGVIDDARIYNRALNNAEIAAIVAANFSIQWRFDETSGTTAVDSGTAGLDGTYTNGTTLNTAGPYPGEGAVAAQFDGTDDFVDLPNLDTTFAQGFSAAIWVKPTQALSAGQTQAMLNFSNGANVDEIWLGWVGGVGFQLYMTDTDDGSPLRTIEDNTDLELNTWVHLVATVDASGNAKLYRNGVLTKSQFTSIPTDILRTQNSIATSPDNDYFQGMLGDVQVFARELSTQEVSELYGLIGHWTFDEGSGISIADSSGLANDANFNTGTPVWVDGVYGTALEFDGTNDAITAVDIDPPEKGAVSFWLQSDGPPSSRERPWGAGSDFEIWQDPDGLISMDISTDGYQGGFITTTPLHTADRWYHLVAQYDADDDSYEIYLNGELHKSGISSWAMVKQAASQLSFGNRTGSSERYSGALDDFRLYNRHLSVSEINSLYGRLAYWKLDETSGSVAADSTERGNDGNYVGIPTMGLDGAFVSSTGTAVQLDGSSESVDTGKGLLNNLPAFSMLGWVRADDLTITQSFFGQNNVIEFGLNVSSGELTLWSEAASDYVSTDNQLPPGKWTHLAATGDGSELKIYLNGNEVASEAFAVANYGSHTDPFKLGEGVFNASGDYFGGRLDEVQIFDRALTPEEIFGTYRGGRPAGVRILRWVESR